MPRTYRLSPSAAEQDTNRILVRSLSFSTAVMLIPLFVMLFTAKLSQPRALMTVIAGYSLVVGFVIYRTIRRTRRILKNAIETFELTVDDAQITRTQRECPTIVVSRNDIQRLSERAGQGFKIETANARHCIWVPRELEGYEELKAQLLATTAGKASIVRHPLAATYGAQVLIVVGIMIVLFSQRRSLVTTVGAAVLCFYIYYVIHLMRTWRNLSRTMRRSLWVMALPALVVVARIASMWR